MKRIVIILVALVGVGGFIALLGYKPTDSASSAASTSGSANVPSVVTAPFKDGTYSGDAISTSYGNVQVSATVSGGKLSAVSWLQTPSDRNRSQEISNMADPQLVTEAIAAQSAQVDVISGASSTSEGFAQSLNSALAHAKA